MILIVEKVVVGFRSFPFLRKLSTLLSQISPLRCGTRFLLSSRQPSKYYPGQKNRYSREIHVVDRQSDHVISSDIGLRFDIDTTRGICASRARVADRGRCRERYHMIALRIILMNISAVSVTIFLARVVEVACRTSIYTVFDTFLLAVLLSLDPQFEEFFSISLVYFRANRQQVALRNAGKKTLTRLTARTLWSA